VSDRLLWTRRQKAVDFLLKVAGSVGPTIGLAVAILATGGRATAIAVLVFGGLIAFAIATGVRTARGALVGGLVIAGVILALQLAVAWLIDNPILE
jgi:hypothetical protein